MPAPVGVARLREALQRGSVDPVYLFEGPEAFFHEEAFRLLEAAALAPGSAGVNRHILDGDAVDLVELLDLASTYPMGPGRRLILVRRAARLRAESADPLRAYLAGPNPRTCLVFSDLEFDERRAVYKALAALATRIRCEPLRSESEVAAWVRERLRARSYGITEELAEAVGVGLGGAGLARLDAELQKLMSAIGAPRPVEAKDLEVLAGVPKVGSAFEVARAALRGDRGAALRDLRALLEGGEQAPAMLGALAWYVRSALKARAAGDRRLPARDLYPLYGLSPSRADQFRAETGGATAGQLRRALRLCREADREIKGLGSKRPEHALERLVHGLARATRRVR
jgi:DNA polymerase-3 subunit delta